MQNSGDSNSETGLCHSELQDGCKPKSLIEFVLTYQPPLSAQKRKTVFLGWAKRNIFMIHGPFAFYLVRE